MPANRSIKSVRRVYDSFYRGMKRYQQETGVMLQWYEWDWVNSTMNDTYDEGPSRRWLPPKPVPAIFLYFTEAPEIATEEGHYTVNTEHFTVSVDALRKAGIRDPLNTDVHFFDRFLYNNFLYSIDRYEKQGFVHGEYLTIGVDGRQVKDEELQIDYFPWYESATGGVITNVWMVSDTEIGHGAETEAHH